MTPTTSRTLRARGVTLAFVLSANVLGSACAVALPVQKKPASALALMQQAEGLPAGFMDHFFGVPLAVRLQIDGHDAGNAMAVLQRDETVQLIEMLDADGSTVDAATTARWVSILKRSHRLGTSDEEPLDASEKSLLALHYSLEESVLSVASNAAENDGDEPHFLNLPETNTGGVILQNRLNLSGGQEQSMSGNYALSATASVGKWTGVSELNIARGGWRDDAAITHRVSALFAQREFSGHFARVGYFTPSMQGLTLTPNLPGSNDQTTLGMMVGTSDALLNDTHQSASLYPVHVTADRPSTAEIYRNGILLYSQAVPTGVHAIDTRQLPGGVYDVEIRLVEDGRVTSKQSASIYKPDDWHDTDRRFRYTVFAGKRKDLLDTMQKERYGSDDQAATVVGVAANYLVHPRVVLGGSVQRIGTQTLVGTALQWRAHDQVNVYANLYQTSSQGTGASAQASFDYGSGSITLSHNRSWLDTRAERFRYRREDDRGEGRHAGHGDHYRGQVHDSSLYVNHRFSPSVSVGTRVSYRQRQNDSGVSTDVNVDYTTKISQRDARWRVSLFDRPAVSTGTGHRNRGVELSLNIALGKSGSQVTTSVGSRSGNEGERDHYASVQLYKETDLGPLKSVNAGITKDRYGVGATAGGSVEHTLLQGDAYASRSSVKGRLSGGLNISNTVAIGGSHIALTGRSLLREEAGVIVDVDTDMQELELRATDSHSSNVVLKPGRNFVPVQPYRAGTLEFDFEGKDAPTAALSTTRQNYHVNKGGVDYVCITVARTVTAMGRLVDAAGKPVGGARVSSQHGSAITGADGFFALDVSTKDRTLKATAGSDEFDLVLPTTRNANESENDASWIIGDMVAHALSASNTTHEGTS